MKTQKYSKYALGFLMLAALSACGGGDDEINGYGYNHFSAACGGANIDPNMVQQQTVVGVDPFGAEIRLLIYGPGNGQVGAVGELIIPNMAAYFVGASGSYRGCVSTQGISGQMQMDGTYDEIQITLQGSGVTLTPSGPYTPIITNQKIKGDFMMNFHGQNQIKLMF
jgi:hypothetical protein